ncbi:Bifunctional polymyxin resistance protein ArnA [Fusobacterium sp. DD29]|uniref:NAD-dependent epimerase/dehydratase family protein n=1 Tax=unclassified Fusobacterium TaxID=2648384 RepID=UPI001B8C698D|nr:MULTISPECIES: NAD-dependent epimerase/dehydratase family protein [unclassified Fusobacterium]MBR8700687.1 Bifunctional polymyxin resistance protein ArnA [Fusobacterium sp. DD45]MBR8710778.1 Bifunctional polymyxin resistance protein ArnA [Fusobacterium sp. DD28]MBR8748913.1 Bifunctional polymyxin resistance protein ArnA [Fusobacterium sp. DD29]MBR8751386.1 Bifunctional polymyxin resistance protein ArnA [Fusobacterium sp. DD26]MBR8761185.1 Bifunctional polymyxin resistance protein ArnA [Fusob
MITFSNHVLKEDLKKIINSNIAFEKLKGKSILITGATGMLATYITFLFVELNMKKNYNINIFALVRNKEKGLRQFKDILNEKNFHLITQDITSPIDLNESIDYIFHLASSANPQTIKKDPLSIIKANTIGTLNVFEFARHKNSRVFFASTREVYGKIENRDYIAENDMGTLNPLEDRACYPESKRMSETICRSYFLQYGVRYQIARIAHVYGPGMNIDNDGRIMSDIISNVVKNEDIILKSDGSAIRSFCYITDAIEAMMLILLEGLENEVYNISNEVEEVSIKNLANLCVDIFPDKKIKVKCIPQHSSNNLYTNYKRVGLNNKKLNSLGWSPKISLKEGIENTVKSFN